ncbi:MAG: PF00070 family, FAD-dependent NAD(P)-disulphide oxidoreductase [uncultured Frankineae bacterium]|uniref:PF00070 family, FAD-dependent NAD(P)-disulphide oxidoreductase n=1 Tax=uncultured Frankineae bacterium TaxID=437475 RepID=A0A6J4M6X6_9ACTN|nr:MAG: PF00070 family, FAD-dependent NAD(P)-disulphide oxidoreductase [uncultured Frankineae bacterium]
MTTPSPTRQAPSTQAVTTQPTPHPTDHPPSALAQTEYDVVVLGAGPTGENVADYAVRGGLTAVVVEPELVGGECSYWACMPSKALLRPVEVLASARAVDGARQAVTGELDAAAVLRRRDGFTSGWQDGGQVGWLDGIGVPLVRGTGRLAGEREVEVEGNDGSSVRLRARHAVVVCTGSAAALPPVEGLADVRPWTSREATSASAAPGRLLVLGGGVVGVEMATAWSALGSQVVLLQRGPGLLPAYEPEAAALVTQALRDRGIEVRTSTDVTAARRDADGSVVVTAGGEELVADELLVATGRRPRTDDLGLETVGLEPGRPLATDDTLLVTGVDGGWLYAAGDVTGRVLLTHQGKYQARACGQVVAARAKGLAQEPGPWSRFTASADDAAVPQVVFTDPQIASVGLTEAAARERGIDVWTAEHDLGAIAGAALVSDDPRGWAKLVVDPERAVVLGATFVGPDVAELLHSATVAVVGEVPLDRLWHAVPSYPTVSEIWLRLLEHLVGRLGWDV